MDESKDVGEDLEGHRRQPIVYWMSVVGNFIHAKLKFKIEDVKPYDCSPGYLGIAQDPEEAKAGVEDDDKDDEYELPWE